jgi:hypothetical protein
MSFRKTVARAVIVGALGLSALGLGQSCWPQNCQGDQRGDRVGAAVAADPARHPAPADATAAAAR